jgi:hypothetical protein
VTAAKHPRLVVHLGVFVDDGQDHADPIGIANLELPLEVFEQVPHGIDDASLHAALRRSFVWDRWLAEVREAVEAIAGPCKACGGSTLCPACAGEGALLGYACRMCRASGRCPTCTPVGEPGDVGHPLARPAPPGLRLVAGTRTPETPGA